MKPKISASPKPAEIVVISGIIGIKVWIFKGEVFDMDAHAASLNADSKK